MQKKAERLNVLTEGNGKNFVHAIVNAVTKGYADNTIIEDILDLVRTNEVSKGVIATCPEALRSYADSITNSLKTIADEVENFEIQDAALQVNRKKRVEEQENQEQKPEAEEPEQDFGIEDVEEIEQQIEEIEKKQQEEKNKNEEETSEKKSSVNDKIVITEDWEKCGYNEKEDKIAGTLSVDFNQDMSMYKKANQITLKKPAVDYIKNRIFSYFKSEYPQMTAKIDDSIFKGNMAFIDMKSGKATVEYEIPKPFETK